jgi:hypothetical protein
MLTLLAPDIVEAILDGRQPAELGVQVLREGLPVEWGSRRRRRLVGGQLPEQTAPKAATRVFHDALPLPFPKLQQSDM